MRIGIAFDLKQEVLEAAENLPDDWQEEFDSPVTIQAITDALSLLGHQPIELGDGRSLVQRLLTDPPDLVFNIAEGHGTARSREARVPAVCDMLGIACTGSDPLTLAVALDKNMARILVAAAGVRVPWGRLILPGRPQPEAADWPFPVIVKPAWEGSSKGIRSKCLVETVADLAGVIETLTRDYRQPLLVEEFIQGDELTVGLLGPTEAPEVLGVMRVVPNVPTPRFVYSLEVKRDYRRQVRYECPPPLPTELLSRIELQAQQAYQALGCRDVARMDFRLRDGQAYFLEANPLPGLNPESSDLVILAGLRGIGHAELIGRILDAALRRLAEH